MDLKSLSLLSSLLLSAPAMAGSHLLVLGGGGDPDCKFAHFTGPYSKPNCESTIFDDGLSKLSENLQRSKWRYQIAFDGGHSKTESMIKDKFKNPMSAHKNFTAINYDNLLKEYETKISSGVIKSGDKLMILITAHGDSKQPGQISHSIAAEGSTELKTKNDLSLMTLVSLDSLAKLIKLADQHGVKLGIIDTSCRSGNTLALAKGSKNTCIISSTGKTHYTYMGPQGFSDNFFINLKAGRNLEDIFLKARRAAQQPEYPMISTEMNDQITDYMYEKITPYLLYQNSHYDIVTDYVLKNSRPEIMCKRDQQFQDLINKIHELEKITASKNEVYDGRVFKAKLSEYKKLQDNIMNKLKADVAYLDKKETFSLMMHVTGGPPEPLDLELSWQKIISLNANNIVSMYDNFAKEAKTLKEKESNQYVAAIYRMVAKKQAEILKAHPQLETVREDAKNLTSMIKKSFNLAAEIVAEEKKLYDGLYRNYSQTKNSNPCREFVF